MTPPLTVLPDPAAVARAAAENFVDETATAISARGHAFVALSGGRTPLAAYELLAGPYRSAVDWERLDLFWADERAVPLEDPASNCGAARTALLDRIPNLDPARIHRMPADAADLDAAAREYEAELRRVVPAGVDGIPVLDLVWLGMGTDGHTASLCPNDASLLVTDRLVVATWPAGYDTARLTMTYPMLNAARAAAFLVTGAEKAPTLAAIRAGADLPASRIHGPRVEWLVDAAAAGMPVERTA